MKNKAFIFIILFIFSSLIIYSQDDKKEMIIENLVEEIMANADDDVDFSTVYDDLEYFYDNPLNLNEATIGQLNKLHFLDQVQISSILDYLKKYGNFQTIYELQMLDGFDMESIQQLLPFVTIAPPQKNEMIDFQKALKYGKHQIFIRSQNYLQPQAGYNIPDSIIQQDPDKSRYLGDSYKYYFRYIFKYRDKIHWGLTAEKDPGEQFFKGAQKYGFDFYSAHLQVNDLWKFDKIIIGDFQAQFGEGLALWSGLAFGKSSFALNVKKKPRGIRYYSSSDENLFLRGAATTMNFGDFSVSAFGSYHKIDANLADEDTIDDPEIDVPDMSSILNTGYHRTPSEIQDRHTIGQTVFGGNVSYYHEKFRTGLTFVDYYFSANLIKDVKPYQLFEFQGTNNFNVGWDYQFEIKKMYFFGETAISKNGGIATVNAISIPLDHKISIVALYRNYSPQYQAFFSGAFAEGSSVSNEKGLYFGAQILPIAKFKITAYIDYFTYPWLKYRINEIGSQGIEYFTQIDYVPSRKISMYLRYKREIKPENISSEDVAFVYPVEKDKWSARFHFSYQISKNLNIRSRVEFVRYSKNDSLESGFMAYQDLNYKFMKIPLTVNLRYAIFDAPYNARSYAYESDLLYAFSVPGYFYKGFRTYVNLKYDVNKHLSIWFKYAQFSYSDRTIISEGSLNEIEGNTKSEVKLQLRYKF